jgi:hypothetical protein
VVLVKLVKRAQDERDFPVRLGASKTMLTPARKSVTIAASSVWRPTKYSSATICPKRKGGRWSTTGLNYAVVV